MKKQKETRSKTTDIVMTESDSLPQKQKRKTVTTDVVLLQTPKGSFEYVISPIDAQGQPLISLEEMIKYKLKARNQEKLSELITYITKHEGEIINYELLRQTAKTIGSGRMEKGVEQVIGHRQKNKGMSWSALLSRALLGSITIES